MQHLSSLGFYFSSFPHSLLLSIWCVMCTLFDCANDDDGWLMNHFYGNLSASQRQYSTSTRNNKWCHQQCIYAIKTRIADDYTNGPTKNSNPKWYSFYSFVWRTDISCRQVIQNEYLNSKYVEYFSMMNVVHGQTIRHWARPYCFSMDNLLIFSFFNIIPPSYILTFSRTLTVLEPCTCTLDYY